MINNISIMGRLTDVPTLKHTQSGLAVTSFSIAVDRKYAKSKEERQTDFFRVTAWNHQAEFICKYFNKGETIGIEGSLQTSSYTDRNGTRRDIVEIIVSQAHFAGGSKISNQTDNTNKQVINNKKITPNIDYEEIEIDDEDLPF